MGALLSVPLAVTPAISMAGSWIASCCGAAAFSAVCSACGKCSSSIATRIVYALMFLVNSILSWVMLTDFMVKKLEKITLDYMQVKCLGKECYGFVAVQRLNFALGLLHFILAVLLIGVRSSRNPRAGIQNGYWGIKMFGWVLLSVVSFLIPDAFFVFWGNYFAMAGSIIFILIGLILLVDFAHSWAETCLQHVEEEDSTMWRVILVGSTVGMYVGSLVLTVLMYVFFANNGCSMNQAAITINFLLTVIVSVVSINPKVQEYNPQAGLAQSAMVSIYCAYLTMSAVAAEPDDKSCNPLIRSRETRTASIVLGAVFTFLAIAYTTTRAATQTSTIENRYEPVDSGHNLVTQEPSRSEMRAQAIRSAVDQGNLPASALDEDWSDDDDEENEREVVGDDEKSVTRYNYTLFHLVFMLATQWTATLLTMNVQEESSGDFAPVGRTYFSSWTKIISAWICFILYGWTLIAPVLFPDRF